MPHVGRSVGSSSEFRRRRNAVVYIRKTLPKSRQSQLSVDSRTFENSDEVAMLLPTSLTVNNMTAPFSVSCFSFTAVTRARVVVCTDAIALDGPLVPWCSETATTAKIATAQSSRIPLLWKGSQSPVLAVFFLKQR